MHSKHSSDAAQKTKTSNHRSQPKTNCYSTSKNDEKSRNSKSRRSTKRSSQEDRRSDESQRGRKRSRSPDRKRSDKRRRSRSSSRSRSVKRSETDSEDERRVIFNNEEVGDLVKRREKVYANRSMKKYSRGAKRSQRRLLEREKRRESENQPKNSKENAQNCTQSDGAELQDNSTQQQPSTQQLQTLQTQPHKNINMQNQASTLTIAEQSQSIMNWSMTKIGVDNVNLKKEVEDRDQTIMILSKENIELKAREAMLEKQLKEAEARAVKAELEAKESASAANEGVYRKLYHTQMANLSNFLRLGNEMIEETFQGEARTAEYNAAVKYHSNSIYLANDKRIPMNKLKEWANEPDATLIRKSHKRGFKFIKAVMKGEKEEKLIKVKDEKSEGKTIGEYNFDE